MLQLVGGIPLKDENEQDVSFGVICKYFHM